MAPVADIGDLVTVWWVDACHRFDASRGEDLGPVQVRTYGRLVDLGDECVSVAAETFPGDQDSWRGVTTIPASCVHRLQVLVEADDR